MTLPASVQNKLIHDLSALLEEAQQAELRADQIPFPFARHGDFVKIQQKTLFIIIQLNGFNNPQLTKIYNRIQQLHSLTREALHYGWYTDFEELKSLISVLKDSLEADILGSLHNLIIVSVSADYMLQARHLLDTGYHVAAAVLIGGVLEDALRRLCSRQNPQIPLDKTMSNGKLSPKTLNDLIEDLKKANLYSELKAKQLRAWAGLRNDAAHQTNAECKKEDIELMYAGIERFIADYL